MQVLGEKRLHVITVPGAEHGQQEKGPPRAESPDTSRVRWRQNFSVLEDSLLSAGKSPKRHPLFLVERRCWMLLPASEIIPLCKGWRSLFLSSTTPVAYRFLFLFHSIDTYLSHILTQFPLTQHL